MRGTIAAARSRDPTLYPAKRSLRAAVVVPSAFAIATVLTSNSETQLFAAFGSFALMLFVDFPGSPRVKLRSLGVLLLTGALFIVVGTLCSQEPVAAVTMMAVIGFAVLFAGILSPQVAAGTIAALLTFVLPVGVAAPPDQIVARLGGWLLAAVLAVPATLLVWPRPFHDELRRRLSSAARALGTLAAAHAGGRRDQGALIAAQAELDSLQAQFVSTSYPPTGAAPGDAALGKLVGRMQWVGTNAVLGDQHADLLTVPEVAQVNGAVAEVLTASAALICDGMGRPVHDRAVVDRLQTAVAELRVTRLRSQDVNLGRLLDGTAEARAETILAEPTLAETGASSPPRLEGTRGRSDDRLLEVLDPTFRTRALAFAAEMVARATFEASGIGREPGAEGRRRERAAWGSNRRMVASHISLRSVWLRNSLRGAIGMALAVAVVKATNVDHGFWVILGAISVLRSNALGTGATVLRALAGTVVGFVVGSAVMVGLGDHHDLLWAILPVAVLVAGVAPSAISFAAGQAGFTVVVVILFNIIQPSGWKVGLTRIEDVAIGCGVSLVVGLLFWPRGATAALGGALCDAYVAGSAYLVRAVERITSPDDDLDTEATRLATEAPYQRMEDALRQYTAERGPKSLPPTTVTSLFTGAVHTRVAAYSLATLPRRAVDPSLQPIESVIDAGDSLRRSVADAHRWYQGVGEVLAGRTTALPPPCHHEAALHRLLVTAFLTTSRQQRTTDAQAVLRMLWADESLEDELALQHELAGAVEQFARRRRSGRRGSGSGGAGMSAIWNPF